MARDHYVRLRLDDGVVTFGGLHALGPISLEVCAGECLVLLGPSGCGKSTLLSALAGLQKFASGTLSLTDQNKPPGFVFQEPNLMPWANALENVTLPLALAGAPRAQQMQAASTALDLVGLSDFAATRPRALSGGMAMRVALARALVDDPSVLLLDEPFGAIDELGRRVLNDLVHKVKNHGTKSVLFVTHSVEEAVYIGDRILVLSPRPAVVKAQFEIPHIARDGAFLTSPLFGELVSNVRRALSQAIDVGTMGSQYEVN